MEGIRKTMNNKRKKTQQDEENQQQQKITRYMENKQQQKRSETTTTTSHKANEQQQPNNINGEEEEQQQSERHPPKLTIRTKGIEITDMKEFLAQKKRERAALFGKENFKSNLAELHTQQKKLQIQRAQRTDGRIGRDEPDAMGSSAANGD